LSEGLLNGSDLDLTRALGSHSCERNDQNVLCNHTPVKRIDVHNRATPKKVDRSSANKNARSSNNQKKASYMSPAKHIRSMISGQRRSGTKRGYEANLDEYGPHMCAPGDSKPVTDTNYHKALKLGGDPDHRDRGENSDVGDDILAPVTTPTNVERKTARGVDTTTLSKPTKVPANLNSSFAGRILSAFSGFDFLKRSDQITDTKGKEIAEVNAAERNEDSTELLRTEDTVSIDTKRNETSTDISPPLKHESGIASSVTFGSAEAEGKEETSAVLDGFFTMTEDTGNHSTSAFPFPPREMDNHVLKLLVETEAAEDRLAVPVITESHLGPEALVPTIGNPCEVSIAVNKTVAVTGCAAPAVVRRKAVVGVSVPGGRGSGAVSRRRGVVSSVSSGTPRTPRSGTHCFVNMPSARVMLPSYVSQRRQGFEVATGREYERDGDLEQRCP